jgi:choline-sulfatase
VFTADHGEFLGERGLWYKMSFLEPSARVPLIVRSPAHGGPRRYTEPVSLLDLAPTVLELVGGTDAVREAAMDGESLVPALAGGPEPIRRPVVCEYHAEGVNAPAAMVRAGRHKLIVCREDPDLLYDLESDPHELSDISAQAATVSRLRAALAEQVDLAAIEPQVLASQRQRHLVGRALAEGTVTAWDYQPQVDAAMQYVRSRADLYELQRRARLESR